MTAPLTLFDLFGETTIAGVAAVWPQRVQPTTGVIATWPPPSLSAWLAALNNAVTLSDVRTGADGNRVSVEAKLAMAGSAAYPDGFPFVISSMPDVEFRIQPATTLNNTIQLFASMTDRGIELVLERLPVEIRLPAGLIDPHPQPGGGIPDGTPTFEVGPSFRPGHLDDLTIRYDRGLPTSIFVHIRLHMTEDGEFDIRPTVPVSFGKCVFSGIPCLALHDFQLLPSPTIAPHNVHWLRHEVTSWAPTLTGPLDGCFSIRSVHIDPDTAPISDLAHWLNSRQQEADSGTTVTPPAPTPGGQGDAHAEFVLDDLVLPFYSPWVLPIPRHVTVGVRRRILDKDDPREVFAFDNAPVRAYCTRGPLTGLIVDSFFFKSSLSGVGLTFDAALVFGQTHDSAGHSDAMAIGIALEENYTLSLAYKRDFSSSTGMPQPGTGAAATINALLHWEIATITIDIMTIRIGFSLGRFFGEQASVGDSFLATVDLFVAMPPTGGSTSLIKLRSLNGEVVKFTIEGVGWRFGSFHLEGVALPDGVALVIADHYGLVIQELGLRAEDHATYFSISGGVLIERPVGFKGSLLVRRLRWRVAGDAGAPPVKLDGFFLSLQTTGFYLEAGGYYTETRAPGVLVREFGLTGTVRFGMGGVDYTFGLDFLIGHSETPAETFDYLLAQVVFRGSIPIGLVELRGIRVLFARNMKPKLQPVDRESRELRYYTWYRNSDPLTVPGDRRLASWAARNDSLAFGLGASVSFAGFGTIAELAAFVLYVGGPDEQALLIVIEIRLLHNPHAIGYLAIELDFNRGLWRGVLGVELRLSDFVTGAPAWLNNIGRLTGTLFIGNDPGTFAIGRLADQRTWLALRFDWDVWVRTFFEAGLCLEFVSGGPNGVGFFIRIEGGINAGIVKVVYHAGFGFSFAVFATASHDYAAVIWIEAGLRIVLFGFLHFGLSARAAFRVVGSRPSRGELRAEIRLETPWFLPDVTWTFELTFGTLAPADLATSTSPLRAAGGSEGLLQKSAALHAERFDQAYANDRASRTFSVNELRAGGPSEATRLANFAADMAVHPIAIDATLAVEFAVAVNDKLALSTGVAPNLGNQKSGDLALTYDLTGIKVRRRARFGSDRAWHDLDERVELPPDFSDPSGVKLTGTLAEETIAARWDLDETIAGKPATKRLLLNSATPFQFATSDPAKDEQLVRDHPEWPCCPARKKPTVRIHVVTFEHEPIGADLDAPRLFSDSASRFTFTRPAIARPQRIGTSLPPDVVVAEAVVTTPGVVARMEFDEDVGYCVVRIGWSAARGAIMLVAFDSNGTVVGTRTVPTTPASDFQTVLIGAQGPIRRIELRTLFVGGGDISTHVHPQQTMLEIHSALYIGLSDYLDFVGAGQACDYSAGGFRDGYEGRGKLFFLPNHEYEIRLTTRVTVSHPSTLPESADVPEYLYFKTKGLPGLNAVQRVGEEVEQYVQSAYAGGRGLLYRREPVVLCFKEDFFVAVPLTLRPAGTTSEHTALMRMKLLVRADTAITPGTAFTATNTDWIVAHRTVIAAGQFVWDARMSVGATIGTAMRTTNPFRERLAVLTQRPEVTCPLADPRDVVGTALIAPPQGERDPDDPAKELWPALLGHTAIVRMEGAPFVERAVFYPVDLSAMQFSLDGGSGDAGAWHVVDGAVTTYTGTARRLAIFGEPDWNHLAINVSIALSGTAAGVAVALPAGPTPSQGLFALIEATTGGHRLVLYRRTTGTEMIELAHAPLPTAADPSAPMSLQVVGFDDRIRATVGEMSIEAERGEQREGRLALVATGAATFGNLGVAGVPIYAFPFRTSRWCSFRDHVLSFPGTIDSIGPDSLGAGTTTSTVAALWSMTQGDLTAVMHPDADPAARDDVFGRWVKALGIPLKDEVAGVEISRFVVGGHTECLLLESPEPIDFTAEVAARLERRVVSTSGSGIIIDAELLGGLVGELLGGLGAHLITARGPAEPSKTPVPEPPGPRPVDVLGEFALAEAAGNVTPVEARAGAVARPRPSVQITDVARHETGIDVEVRLDEVPAGALADDRVIFIERADDGARLRIYTGRIGPSRLGGSTARVHAIESDDVTVLRTADSIFGSGIMSGMSRSVVVAVLPGIGALGGNGVIVGPIHRYDPVASRVIQNGAARRALIVPISDAAVPLSLDGGRYRLTLTIDRARWGTTAPPDDLNRYRDTATIAFDL